MATVPTIHQSIPADMREELRREFQRSSERARVVNAFHARLGRELGEPPVRLAFVREYDNLERVLLDSAAYVALDPTAGEGEV